MSAEAQIKLGVGRLAKLRQTWKTSVTGTGFWALAHAAGDEVYENVVKGQTLTNVDDALEAGAFGDQPDIANWLQLHLSYFTLPVVSATPGLGLAGNGWDAYLASVGWRLPYEFAELVYDKFNRRITPARVFGKGTWVANEASPAASGAHKFSTWTASGAATGSNAVNDGALTITNILGAPVVCVSETAAQTGTLTLTVTLQDGTTTHSVAAGAYSTSAQYTQKVVGEVAVTGSVTAGATSITAAGIGTAGHVIAGQYALIYESDALQEVFLAGTVTTNAVAVAAGIKKDYTTAAKIWPLYSNAIGASCASFNPTKGVVTIWARPDRVIAL